MVFLFVLVQKEINKNCQLCVHETVYAFASCTYSFTNKKCSST